MKPITLLAIFALPAHAAVVWNDNFENYDTNETALEAQSPDWLTDPIGTDAIAVIDNATLNAPTSFGSKSLAIGGIIPVGETNPGVAYALSPLATQLDSTVAATLSVDLILNSGTANSITDSFRFGFADLAGTPLSTLVFAPSATSGMVSIFRSNMVDTFDTGVEVSVNTAFSLDIVMNFELNKWTATVAPVGGGAPLSLFANVNMTESLNSQANLDSFAIDWIRAYESEWGDNFLVADNFALTSQIPEASSSLLASGLALLSVLRRRR